MTEQWSLAVKARLGNVYHVSTGRGLGYPVARCDKRIRLLEPKTETPGTPEHPGYVCQRCAMLSAKWGKR